MLAGFIGLEVIRRVSPFPHTPLMSLTNALDAITVVGAIILAGEHKNQLFHRARNHRHRSCHKTLVLFGDAKSFVGSIVREISGGAGH
jgi:NAD/NADP transhydrogenase alpha subunit